MLSGQFRLEDGEQNAILRATGFILLAQRELFVL